MNRHFQASRTSQPIGYLFFLYRPINLHVLFLCFSVLVFTIFTQQRVINTKSLSAISFIFIVKSLAPSFPHLPFEVFLDCYPQMQHGNTFNHVCLSVCLPVCLYACLSVCLVGALTFESLGREISFLTLSFISKVHVFVKFVYQDDWAKAKVKVTGAKSV